MLPYYDVARASWICANHTHSIILGVLDYGFDSAMLGVWFWDCKILNQYLETPGVRSQDHKVAIPIY